ncbi:TonB-dependent receptor [Sphingobacterium sp. DN00404]|uniref:TonB-dependent receptor n=1 Tax=Sphingobacterium micropteri TaxID=2763501 RepID=A0ABR7YL37_9SPHI|nr:TonB-dependent receptor [Sphingobacterium micropteri]MBD1431974.1 TonB-dependent receptor [Sphingobacterium micropteri]
MCLATMEGVFAQEQTKTIAGTVTDSLGVGLPGISISAQDNPRIGTRTDVNGKYVLDVRAGTILRFSNVGFVDRLVTVQADQDIVNVMLEESNTGIDEVVVTALGQRQRREAIVGSVSTVQPGNLKIPASNLTNALAGQVAGVIGYQRSGQPGQDNSNFFIRGVTTFGYKKDPLILIDNVEMGASDLARLQVDDIESFSILKDASATALYGARGGNGVILISTKSGKEGTARIGVRLEQSSSRSAFMPKVADPITYMRLYNQASIGREPLNGEPFSENKIYETQATLDGAPGSNPYVYPAVDWLGLLFKDATSTQRANLNVSGGGGVARYYVAASYNLDNGIMRQDSRNVGQTNVKFQNYQLRANVNIDLSKNTELVVRLSGNFNDYHGPRAADGGFSTDLYNVAIHTSPVLFPAYYEPDEANKDVQHILFGNVGGTGNNSILYNNPYAQLLMGHKNSVESRLSAQLELNQKLNFLTQGLNFRSIFNTNRYAYFDSQRQYSPYYYNVGSYDKPSDTYVLNWLNSYPTGNNVAREYLDYNPGRSDQNSFFYFQASLDYNRSFDKNNISATLIGTAQENRYSNANSLFNSLPYRNMGLAGRLTYNYDNRYFIETNFGYNGSERFSRNNRFGFFPTIGASWVISNEDFWSPIAEVVNKMKLRASYGLVGNDAISDRRFFYLSDVNLNGGGNYASFGTNNYTRNGVFINNYENLDVTWETSRQANFGVEFSLFNRLDVIAEYYNNFKYNILMNRASVPSTLGLESGISANLGEVRSQGVDLSLDYRHNFGNGFSAAVRSNFTFANNKYVKYEEPEWPFSYQRLTGQGLGRRVGYIAERLFVDDEEARNSPQQIFSTNGYAPRGGDIKYRDLNGDGRIDGDDRTSIGFSQDPEIVYGFGLSTSYKNFDLSGFFQGQARASFFMDPERVSPFVPSPDPYIGGHTQLLEAFANDHWSEENQNLYATYPRMSVTHAQLENNRQISTWWMRDGRFIRLKSLEFGYTLNPNFSRRLYLSNARIYLNGLNLFTWAPFKIWDPELGGQGFNYPIQKVFNVGVNVTF